MQLLEKVNMKYIEEKKLLEMPEVVEEIKRHLWIESEKTGYDIGFKAAAEDWFKKFAQIWLDYHKPTYKLQTKTNPSDDSSKSKKRSAKSYIFI